MIPLAVVQPGPCLGRMLVQDAHAIEKPIPYYSLCFHNGNFSESVLDPIHNLNRGQMLSGHRAAAIFTTPAYLSWAFVSRKKKGKILLNLKKQCIIFKTLAIIHFLNKQAPRAAQLLSCP